MNLKMIEEMLDKAEKNGVLARHAITGNSRMQDRLKSPISVWDNETHGKKKVARRGVSCFYFNFPLYYFLYQKMRSDILLEQYINHPTGKYLVLMYPNNKSGKVFYAENPQEASICNCIVAVIRGHLTNDQITSLELVSVYPDLKKSLA